MTNERLAVAVAGAVLLVLLLAKKGNALTTPRGIRNNNPGNIRASGDAWTGLAGADADGYAMFATPGYGLRAAARVVMNYQTRHGIRTLAALAARWAPVADSNDPENYAGILEAATGRNRLEILDLTDTETAANILAGIVRAENGTNTGFPWFNQTELTAAVKAART